MPKSPPPAISTSTATHTPTTTTATATRRRHGGVNSSASVTSDCLETSIQLLHHSVEHAKAWDASCRDNLLWSCDSSVKKEPNNSNNKSKHNTPMKSSNTTTTGTSSASSGWWVSLLQRLQETHQSDRQQWEKDLHKAKHQSQHLKEELRETIEERIAWLEERFLEEIHQTTDTGTRYSRGSTASTTHCGNDSSSQSDGEFSRRQQQQSRRTKARAATAENTAGVEVSLDSVIAMQRLAELEHVVEQHQLEKAELSTVLDHANQVTQQGELLSASMQQQLQTLLKEVDETAQKQKRYYREKVGTQKRLLQLLEEQHNNALVEFKQEKEALEATILQLTADKEALKNELDTSHKQHQQQRDDWEREKQSLQKGIHQLEGDFGHHHHRSHSHSQEGGAFVISSTSEEYNYQDDISSLQPSTVPPHAPPSPHTMSISSHLHHPIKSWEEEEKLDRAMVERDFFKQEAEQVKKELESLRGGIHTSASAGSASEAGLVKELEAEVQHYKKQLDKDVDQYKKLATQAQSALKEYKKATQREMTIAKQKLEESQAESERKLQELREECQQLVHVQEELQSTITDLSKQLDDIDGEQRYRDSVEKRNGLIARLRQLERQHDDERCEWKLRLEAIFSEKKSIQEEKESLEKQIAEIEQKYKTEISELEEKLDREAQKWTECSAGVEEENKRLAGELKDAISKIETQETSFKVEREQWEEFKEHYTRESQEWAAQLQDLGDKYTQEAEQWNAVLDATRALAEDQVAKLREKHAAEIKDLSARLEASKEETRDAIEKHATEIKDLSARLKTSIEETRAAIEKNNDLVKALENVKKEDRSELEVLKELHQKEVHRMSSELESAKSENRDLVHELDTVKKMEERYSKEIEDLRTENRALTDKTNKQSETLAKLDRKYDDFMTGIKKKNKEETERLSTELQRSRDETRALIEKTTGLMENLESLRHDHRQAKMKWEEELQRVIDEKSNQILDLRVQNTALSEKLEDRLTISKEATGSIYDAVEDLRKDVISVRETLESTGVTNKTIANANHIQLTDEILVIQRGLNDALAEITLGSEAMMEMKDIVDEVCRVVQDRPENTHNTQQQEGLLQEMQSLREHLASVVQSQNSGALLLNDSIRQEMVSELQRKESEIAALKARFEQLQVELLSEREKLSSAEKEIATLNDQADAYGEELMRMQALNAGLEETLKATERKMEEAILNNYEEGTGEWSNPPHRTQEDDSSPLLDEALALAQGLTDLVHGRDEDADVMDMLQSLSDLMDQHERGEWSRAQGSNESPPEGSTSSHNRQVRNVKPRSPNSPPQQQQQHNRQRPPLTHSSTATSFRVDVSRKTEHPPEPVQTPDGSTTANNRDDFSVSGSGTPLQLIVEQLYARCQLLERERSQMMEVTLDLLTSARQANETELDAALATARRRAAEEVTRVRQQTQIEKERLYHKLCGKCAQGALFLMSNNNNRNDYATTAPNNSAAMSTTSMYSAAVRG